MTKKDIIKQEIMGIKYIPGGIKKNDLAESGYSLQDIKIEVVDLDRLATLLAKYLPIKIEEDENKNSL